MIQKRKTKSKPKRQPLVDVNDVLSQIHRDNICTATREIWLHSTLAGDDEPGVEYRMATMFLKNLSVLERHGDGPILIHMHVIGGEWNDGMAIYDAIKLSPCETTIIAYAQASSMSGIILQAANRRLLMPNCEFMAHTGRVDMGMETRAAVTLAARNMQSHEIMLDIFAQRCVKAQKYNRMSVEAVRKKLDQWMKDQGEINVLAPEAVENGFADDVIGSKKYPSVVQTWAEIMG
jgi:ATP-dependent protease ClpP protease subunit